MTRETSTLTSQGVQVNSIQDLNAEVRKRVIITELYKTGCLNGIYFGKQKVKNPIRSYIAACLYKQRLAASVELIDDCYNEMFKHIQAMPADKVIAIYTEAPAKLIATALRVVALKCFAIDPRYGNPRHSLIQGITFASALSSNNTIDPCDIQESVNQELRDSNRAFRHDERKVTNHVLVSRDNDPDDFEQTYGFTIEQLLERLSAEELNTFYEMAGRRSRGKVSNATKLARIDLVEKLKTIRASLT